MTVNICPAGRPRLQWAAVASDGQSILLHFDKALERLPRARDFLLAVDGSLLTRSFTVARGDSDREVRLSGFPAITAGQAVTVEHYIGGCAEIDKTDLRNFIATAHNGSTVTSAAGPVLTRARVDPTSTGWISLRFNKTLSRPGPPSAWQVFRNGRRQSLEWAGGTDGIELSGDTLLFDVSSVLSFESGDAVEVRYTDPSALDDDNALQDEDGNDAASFCVGFRALSQEGHGSCTGGGGDLSDRTRPTVTGVDTAGNRSIDVRFDEGLSAVAPPASAFDVYRPVDGDERWVLLEDAVEVRGSAVRLTLHGYVGRVFERGQFVRVRYVDPTVRGGFDDIAIRDRAGNAAAGFCVEFIVGSGGFEECGAADDTTVPTVTGVSVPEPHPSNRIKVEFSEAISGLAPPASAFEVWRNGRWQPVTDEAGTVEVTGRVLTLTPTPEFHVLTNGIETGVRYTDPSAVDDVFAVQTPAGTDADSFCVRFIVGSGGFRACDAPADTTAPTPTGRVEVREIGGIPDRIDVHFSERLSGLAPPASAFHVARDGRFLALQDNGGVEVRGSVLRLDIALPQGESAFADGEVVGVRYVDPHSGANDVHAIQDPAGNDAASFCVGFTVGEPGSVQFYDSPDFSGCPIDTTPPTATGMECCKCAGQDIFRRGPLRPAAAGERLPGAQHFPSANDANHRPNSVWLSTDGKRLEFGGVCHERASGPGNQGRVHRPDVGRRHERHPGRGRQRRVVVLRGSSRSGEILQAFLPSRISPCAPRRPPCRRRPGRRRSGRSSSACRRSMTGARSRSGCASARSPGRSATRRCGAARRRRAPSR